MPHLYYRYYSIYIRSIYEQIQLTMIIQDINIYIYVCSMLNYFSFYINKVSPQVIPSKHAITITRMLASWQEESAPLRHVWIHIKLQTPHLIIEKWKVHQSPGKKNKNIRSSHMRSQYSHLWDGPKDFRIEAAMCFKGAAMVGVECSFPQTKHQGAGNVADQFFFQGLKWGRFPKTVRVTAWTH